MMDIGQGVVEGVCAVARHRSGQADGKLPQGAALALLSLAELDAGGKNNLNCEKQFELFHF